MTDTTKALVAALKERMPDLLAAHNDEGLTLLRRVDPDSNLVEDDALDLLMHFAVLALAEKDGPSPLEQLCQWMTANGFATGHADDMAGALKELEWQVKERVSKRNTPMVILSGDQAQFEIDNAGVAPKDRPDWPLPSFDAQDWAAHFCKLFPGSDEGLMQTWFANALMRGFDEAHSKPLTIRLTPGMVEAGRRELSTVAAKYDGAEITAETTFRAMCAAGGVKVG